MARVERELNAKGAQTVPPNSSARWRWRRRRGETEVFEGEVHGRLVFPPRGNNGFGYDPIFVADGMSQTFGEIDPAQKHAISHRARAFEKFAQRRPCRHERLRALRPLAVLRGQMPLLRFQFPCPRRASTKKAGRTRFCANWTYVAAVAGRRAPDCGDDLFRRRHAVLDERALRWAA